MGRTAAARRAEPSVNVYPSASITPVGAALACVSGLAWAAAVVIAVIDVTNTKVQAVSIGVGITGALCAVALECTARLVRKVEDHAQRVEDQAKHFKEATAELALLTKHVLALERVFQLGLESDRLARRHADGFVPWEAKGTKPFSVRNRDGG